MCGDEPDPDPDPDPTETENKYKQGDPEPTIDYNAGTINGIAYDNITEKCWKVTTTAKYMGVTATDIEYEWATEFVIKASYEYAAWSYAQIDMGSYTFTVEAAPQYKNYDSCYANND